MRFNLKVVFVLLFSFLILSEDTFAQRRKYARRKRSKSGVSRYKGGRSRHGGTGRFRPYEYVGFGVNATNYFGDLSPLNPNEFQLYNTDLANTRPGFSVLYGYRGASEWATRVSLNYFRLIADDADRAEDKRFQDPSNPDDFGYARYARNLNFTNDVISLSAGGEFYFFSNGRGASLRAPVNIYLHVGVSILYSNPKTELPNGGGTVALRNLGTEGQLLPSAVKDSLLSTFSELDNWEIGKKYSQFHIAIPFGLGIQFAIPNTNVDVAFEAGYRWMFTDYLDDVSHRYIDPSLLRQSEGLSAEEIENLVILADRSLEDVDTRPPVVLADETQTNDFRTLVGGSSTGAIRGTPGQNDSFFNTQIRLTYIINKRKKSTAKFR